MVGGVTIHHHRWRYRQSKVLLNADSKGRDMQVSKLQDQEGLRILQNRGERPARKKIDMRGNALTKKGKYVRAVSFGVARTRVVSMKGSRRRRKGGCLPREGDAQKIPAQKRWHEGGETILNRTQINSIGMDREGAEVTRSSKGRITRERAEK